MPTHYKLTDLGVVRAHFRSHGAWALVRRALDLLAEKQIRTEKKCNPTT